MYKCHELIIAFAIAVVNQFSYTKATNQVGMTLLHQKIKVQDTL